MPPTDQDDRRDLVFLGYGQPYLVHSLGDRLKGIFQPRNSMEVYNTTEKFQGASMVMMYSLFEEELWSLGFPQHPLWSEYLEAVEDYVENV